VSDDRGGPLDHRCVQVFMENLRCLLGVGWRFQHSVEHRLPMDLEGTGTV
jgi:hypothetical protein